MSHAHQNENQAAANLRHAEKGFTLLEVLVVLTIIAAAVAFLGRGIFAGKKKADTQMAKTAVSKVLGAGKLYMMNNNNTCPTSLDDLVNTKEMDKKDVKDPWGKEFIIKCPGVSDDIEVYSTGPDKQEGTADDIKSSD